MAENISISEKVLKKLRAHKVSEKEQFSGLLYGLRSGGEALVNGYYSFEESGVKSFLSQFEEAENYVINGTNPLGFFLQSPEAFMQASMLAICQKYFPANSPQQACFNADNILIMSLLNNNNNGSVGGDDDDAKKYFFYHYNVKGQDLESVEVKEAKEGDVKKMRDRFTLFLIQAKVPITIHHTSNFDEKRVSIQHSINQLANQLANKLTIFKLATKQQQKENKQQQKDKKQQKENKQQTKQQTKQQNKQQLTHHNKHILIRNSYKHTNEDDDDYNNNDGNNDEGGDDGNDDGGENENDAVGDDSGSQGDGGCHEGVRMVDIVDVINIEALNLNGYEQRVTRVEMLLQTTGSPAKQYHLNSAPVLYHDHLNLMVISLTLPLDVALLVANDDNTTTMSTHFIRAINKQLKTAAETLNNFSRSSVYYIPKPYHYALMDGLVTLLYPEGVEERQLKETRKRLHQCFLVPLASPFFKRSNHTPLSPRPSNPHLINVHVGLPPSKVKGRVTLVQGSYEYRHYMQDKCNDDGWGCAYRSLQTIASWLYMQGFTEKSVPTHLQIQQALVEVCDKLPSFLGSKKWIGSTEVSYVLDHIYNVQSKICHVSDGREVASKVREIVHHFETQGSPIMIGGGVLAHTIIGVDFDEESGHVAYLVLDPHYTGVEDIGVIQQKGWCGWKDGEFWQQGSFYNMCMPLKPTLY